MSANYGTAIRVPTGYGLPNYEQATFSTSALASNVKYCDEAGVPRASCVHCLSEAHNER
jgi:hypothetical protein